MPVLRISCFKILTAILLSAHNLGVCDALVFACRFSLNARYISSVLN